MVPNKILQHWKWTTAKTYYLTNYENIYVYTKVPRLIIYIDIMIIIVIKNEYWILNLNWILL